MSNLSTLSYAMKVYCTAFPTVIRRLALPVIGPKATVRFFNHILDHADYNGTDPDLGSQGIIEMLEKRSADTDISLIGPYYDRRSSDTRQLMELASLAYLVKSINAMTVFEIGTFVGRMTTLMLTNTASTSRIWTLDLPQNQVPHEIGEAFRNRSGNDRIQQLYGDSTKFDFTPYNDSMDFVWVDACHDYREAKIDTLAAFAMVKPGGWIGWHDYRMSAWWSGVTKAVRETNRSIGGKLHDRGIKHLAGTTTAILHVTSDDKIAMKRSR